MKLIVLFFIVVAVVAASQAEEPEEQEYIGYYYPELEAQKQYEKDHPGRVALKKGLGKVKKSAEEAKDIALAPAKLAGLTLPGLLLKGAFGGGK